MAPSVWLLFVCGLLSLTAVGALPKPRPSAVREGRSCRCVPDQFEVTLISVEREFDLMGEQLREKQASMLVHYDYTNKIFASTEVEAGVRTVADYGKGLKYLIRAGAGRGGGGGGGTDCRVFLTREMMPRMCLPEAAVLVSEYRLSLDVPVSVWRAKGSENMTMSTMVDTRNCLPIYEEMYLATPEFAVTTFSIYANISLGIEDRRVFDPPKRCIKASSRGRQKVGKSFADVRRR